MFFRFGLKIVDFEIKRISLLNDTEICFYCRSHKHEDAVLVVTKQGKCFVFDLTSYHERMVIEINKILRNQSRENQF
jgi:hypothetical protein